MCEAFFQIYLFEAFDAIPKMRFVSIVSVSRLGAEYKLRGYFSN